MAIKLQIISNDTNGNEVTTNVNYIAPSVNDGTMVEFARQIMSFSSNTITNVYKVTTEDISTAEFIPQNN